VLIAVTATAIGFAFDTGSDNKELTNVFAGLYVVGCVAAVLAVRQSGVFTAVIQPPLILFVAVPSAYWLFHGATFTGIKDTLINYGYPLIERFPLMLFTSAAVLLIGMVRWYVGMTGKAAAPKTGATEAAAGTGRFAVIATKLSSLWPRHTTADADEPPIRRRHGIDRPATAAKASRAGRPAKRPAPTRSRHARPPVDGIAEPPPRPRRRPTHAMDYEPAPEPPPPPRRRHRPPRDHGVGNPPREIRRDPHERRDPYPRKAVRGNRFDPYESVEPSEPPRPRRRPAGNGNGAANPTHHPISRVRYRSVEE
jgi:hypothetical protein